MRTQNLIDGLILGLGISAIVVIARWLFTETHLFQRIGVIAIGAVLLILLQTFLLRRRIDQATPPNITSEPTPTQTPPAIVSSRTPWNATEATASSPEPSVPVSIALQATSIDSEADQPIASINQILETDKDPEHPNALQPQPTPDASPEKMV